MQQFTSYFIVTVYFIAGLINTVPIIGVVSNARLTSLYGVDVLSQDLSLLLRHRAVLFLVVGVLLFVSVFNHSLRLIAGVAGLVSMMSFVVLAWTLSDINPNLVHIARLDLAVSVLLVIAIALHLRTS